MDHDRPNRIHFFVRLEVQATFGNGSPHAGGFVGLADVRRDKMLEKRIGSLGHSFIRNGREFIFHHYFLPLSSFGKVFFCSAKQSSRSLGMRIGRQILRENALELFPSLRGRVKPWEPRS
jgi:hypothetical protein